MSWWDFDLSVKPEFIEFRKQIIKHRKTILGRKSKLLLECNLSHDAGHHSFFPWLIDLENFLTKEQETAKTLTKDHRFVRDIVSLLMGTPILTEGSHYVPLLLCIVRDREDFWKIPVLKYLITNVWFVPSVDPIQSCIEFAIHKDQLELGWIKKEESTQKYFISKDIHNLYERHRFRCIIS